MPSFHLFAAISCLLLLLRFSRAAVIEGPFTNSISSYRLVQASGGHERSLSSSSSSVYQSPSSQPTTSTSSLSSFSSSIAHLSELSSSQLAVSLHESHSNDAATQSSLDAEPTASSSTIHSQKRSNTKVDASTALHSTDKTASIVKPSKTASPRQKPSSQMGTSRRPRPHSTTPSATDTRMHTTLTITSKASVTVVWTDYEVTDDSNVSSTLLTTVVPACVAEMPLITYLDWRPINANDTTATDYSSMTARNSDNTLYTTALSTYTNWNGVDDDRQYSIVTTVAYPTQFWDYASQYRWQGSTVGADASCAPDQNQVPICKGTETLWRHPQFPARTTSLSVTDGDTGAGYTPVVVYHTPGPDDLQWFSAAFPDLVALRECDYTSMYQKGPRLMTKPQGAVHKTSALLAGPSTTADSSVETSGALSVTITAPARPAAMTPASAALPANTDTALITLHGFPVQSQSPAPGDDQPHTAPAASTPGQAVAEPSLASNLLPAQIFSEALGLGSVHDALPTSTQAQHTAFTFEGVNVQQSQSVIVMNGNTIKHEGTTVIGSGSHTTAVGMAVDSAGDTALWVGDKSTILPADPQSSPAAATITFAGKTLTQSANQIQVNHQTISLGSSVTLGGGTQALVVAYTTDAAGQAHIAVGTSNMILPTVASLQTFQVDKQTITQSSDVFMIDSKTLRVGQSATIGSGQATTLVRVQTDSNGHTDLIVGSSTTELPMTRKTVTTAGLTVVPVESSEAVINGKTVTVGGTLTLAQASGSVTIVLTTDARGQLAIVEPSTTIVLSSTTQVGEYIAAGLQPSTSTPSKSVTATASPMPAKGAAPRVARGFSWDVALVMGLSLSLSMMYIIPTL